MDDTTVFKVEEAEGTFWVAILSAVEEEVWQDNGRVRTLFPALRVTTYAGGRNLSENRRLISLRGRKYSLDAVHVWLGHEPPHEWGSDHRTYHSRPLETESGSSLDWKSPVRDKLRAIEHRVRDRFVAEHPEWARLSLRLHVAWQIRRAKEDAATHRTKADAADAEAARRSAELEAM